MREPVAFALTQALHVRQKHICCDDVVRVRQSYIVYYFFKLLFVQWYIPVRDGSFEVTILSSFVPTTSTDATHREHTRTYNATQVAREQCVAGSACRRRNEPQHAAALAHPVNLAPKLVIIVAIVNRIVFKRNFVLLFRAMMTLAKPECVLR